MPRNHSPVLEAAGITVDYGKNSETGLSDVSMQVAPGEHVAVVGPNGAGKTTLVRALTGLLSLRAGSVQLFGKPVHELGRREVARRVAVVPQHIRVAFGFTVREVVSMGRAPHQGAMLLPSAADHRVIDAILERTGLSPLAARPVTGLSGGEQKRVAIARALAQQPDLLVLDEATAHLDIRHQVGLHALVREEIKARELAVLSVMHDLSEVAQNADRVIILNQGRIRAQGAVEEVMTYRILRETFGVDLYVGVNELDGTRYFVPIRSVT
ncbi:MAG: ABC transporter ATP-binding protein [Myxococcota bacterium]